MATDGAVIEETGLFSGVPQYDNFARMQHINAVTEMMPSPQPFEFPEGARISLATT